MNAYDSEVAEGLLSHQGYELVPDALESEAHSRNVRVNADVFLMNTCSVREHAEDRVYGRLGMLSKYKETHPDLIIGLMGCMVEEHREKLFRRFPALDLMVGTRNIKELPELIEEVRKNRRQVAKIRHDGISIEYTDQISRKGRFHAWLPIMTGCNKVCTFCIVPITRGSEVSMPARDVYREASRLVSEGVKWITLLGQNVNSYNGSPHPTPLPKGEGEGGFSYSTIFATTPAPTVRPPSRMAKRRPWSIAMGAISSISIVMLSPGITISTPSGSLTTPVTSVVRK